MKLTFKQYIKNPMGNSVMSNRQMYEALYKDKLGKILLRENNQINFFLFKDSDARYLIHMKVPSEKVKHFTYDVVVEFLAPDKTTIQSGRLDDFYVKFFSNDPSFVYTYAYSFIKNDLFIEDLESKMDKRARKDPATNRNKKNEIGYVKSIYFCYLIMQMRNLFNKDVFENSARKYQKNILLQMVDHSSTNMIKRKQAEHDQKEDEKRFARLKKIEPKPKEGDYIKYTNPTKSATTAKRTTKIGGIKTVNTVKRI